jgi:hypothetical protein
MDHFSGAVLPKSASGGQGNQPVSAFGGSTVTRETALSPKLERRWGMET